MIVLRSMAKSFKKNYVLSDPASNSAWQILCSWDFSITNERAITQRKNNLSVQLKVGSYKPGVQHCANSTFPQCNHSRCHFLNPYISIFLSFFLLSSSFQESLSEGAQEMLTRSEKMKHFGIHLGSWLLSTSLAFGCGSGIYFLCQYEQQVPTFIQDYTLKPSGFVS